MSRPFYCRASECPNTTNYVIESERHLPPAWPGLYKNPPEATSEHRSGLPPDRGEGTSCPGAELGQGQPTGSALQVLSFAMQAPLLPGRKLQSLLSGCARLLEKSESTSLPPRVPQCNAGTGAFRSQLAEWGRH